MEQVANRTMENGSAEETDREIVATRAYDLWMKRGCPIGSAELDWYQAELELAEEAAKSRQPVSKAKAA